MPVAARMGLLAVAALATAALGWDPSASAGSVKATLLGVWGLVALGLGVSRVRAHWRERSRLPVAAVAWCAWLGWMLFTSTWASHPVPVVAAAWAGAAGVALGTSTLERSDAQALGRAVASAVLVGSAVACLVELGLGAPPMGRHGLQGNPNWLGLVVACALPLGLEQAAHDVRARHWLRGTLVVGAAASGMAVAGSRVAWVALGVGAIFFGLVRATGVREPSSRRLTTRWGIVIVGVACAAVALLVGLASGAHGSEAPPEGESAGLGDPWGGARASWAGRLWIWRAATAVALHHLPLGTGLGDFHAAFLDEQGARLSSLPAEQAATLFVNATTAHGDWVETLATSGLPGAVLLGVSLAAAFLATRRRWPAAAASLLVVAVAALGDSALQQPAILVMVALLLGASSAGGPALGQRSTTGAEQRRAVGLALTHATAWVATMLLLPFALRAWLAERALSAAETLDPGAREAAIERAIRIDPRSGPAWLRLGIARLEATDPRRALDALARSRERLPGVGTEIALGNALVGLGRLPEAVAAYDRAIRLHPGSFRARLNRAEAARLRGDLTGAARDLAIARRLQPGHPKIAIATERLRKAQLAEATGQSTSTPAERGD